MSEFANRLQSLRKKANLSQEDLAEHLNISRQAVSKWELGQSTPDIDTCLKLCEVLKITPNQLFSGSNNAEENSSKIKNSPWDMFFIISSVFLMLICVCGTIMLICNLYNGKVFEPNIHTLATVMVSGSPITFVTILLLNIRKKRSI